MKKVISLFLIALLAAASLFGLAACSSSDDGIPEGMKIARGGEDLGYYFYVPEGWVISNQGDIAAAYVSVINNTSVSFVETVMPEGYLELELKEKETPEFIKSYFAKERAEMTYDITVSVDGAKTNFGNGDAAYTYVYSFDYKELDDTTVGYTCMQIFTIYKGRFFIFTYMASNLDYNGDMTYYTYYLSGSGAEGEVGLVQSIINNFKFTDRKESTSEAPKYDEDSDGHILISDRTVAGFDLYVPKSYTPHYSESIVSASNADGDNVTVSKVTVNLGFTGYWEMRKSSLEKLADKDENGNTTLVITNDVDPEDASEVVEKNGTKRITVEYKFNLEGKTYYVYQVYIRATFADYMYTYTSYEEIVADAKAEAESILDKIKF